jgi:hypothetical protein
VEENAETIKDICHIYGIKIFYAILPDDLLGRANSRTKTIILNNSLKDNPREEKCVLLEEIGHIIYPARPGHTRYHSKDFLTRESCSLIRHTVAQDERLARDWATNVLLKNIDFDRIKEVGARSINELANYFDVEPWFMEQRIKYLRRKAHDNGQKVMWRDFMSREKR